MAKPPKTRTARIAFARIEYVGDRPDVPTVLRESITRGDQVDSYRRTWTMGPNRTDDGVMVGTVVAESEVGGRADTWNPTTRDIETRRVPEGHKTSWAINVNTLRVAFQLKPRIDRPAFVRALGLLLNSNDPDEPWIVRSEIESVSFGQWVKSVDHLTSLSVRIDKPNPNYADNDQVESLIENLHAEKIRIAAEGEDLDFEDSPLLNQSVAHADRGYGEYTAIAARGGGITRYDSEKAQAPPEVEVPADTSTGDVLRGSLRQAVEGDAPKVLTTAVDGEIPMTTVSEDVETPPDGDHASD